MRLFAPAKINMYLRVGPPAPDGFHPLLTWMCTVSLFDTLTLSVAGPGEGSRPIALNCDDPGLPCDDGNLVVRAGMALVEAVEEDARTGSTREGGDRSSLDRVSLRGTEGKTASAGLVPAGLPRMRISLQKSIPSGAGLGGGSSDGAAAMLGLNRAWRTNLAVDRLAELSAGCGSDLPFFFYGSSSVCTGRGQKVRPIAPPAARWGVLMLPDIAMPTMAVYRKFDELKLGERLNWMDAPETAPDWGAWARLPARELLPRLVNDLEAPAFSLRPDLGALRSELESRLGQPVRMSGSGSSLFTLFDEEAPARDAARRLGESIPGPRTVAVEVAPKIQDDFNEGIEET
jgi:4-diphosphocytidyl-2-C-methyl-D-erythritol kinase